MKRNESCTIDLEQQPLMEVWEQIRAPISRTENLKGRSSIEVRTEATRNFILKDGNMDDFLMTFLEVLFREQGEVELDRAVIAGKVQMSLQN